MDGGFGDVKSVVLPGLYAGLCLAVLPLSGCSGAGEAPGFSTAATALQTYDYSRLTPFPRKAEKAPHGQPYMPDEAELAQILRAVAPQLSDPASGRVVRVQARTRTAGVVELCGLAQSMHQSGGDARMMLFVGHLTRAPDGSPHFSVMQTDTMFDRVEFCRSRGLV